MLNKGDVFIHWQEKRYFVITDIRKIGTREIVYFQGTTGNRNQLSVRQFENPVILKNGSSIERFKLANDDKNNPWRKK